MQNGIMATVTVLALAAVIRGFWLESKCETMADVINVMRKENKLLRVTNRAIKEIMEENKLK